MTQPTASSASGAAAPSEPHPVPSGAPIEAVPSGSSPTDPASPTASAKAAATPQTVVAEGAGRRFGDVRAVDGLDLAVPPGTLLGLIGPSGSGKTTTIRMLTGQLRPTSGRLRVLGEDPMHFRRQTRERIGYMPQLFVLYPDLTAKENLDFVGSLFGMLWPRRRRRVREVLELVDLWPARDRRASALSGGMQRRLELACALVHDPVLLFLDEPTAGIDPLLRERIWTELRRLREAGRTLLVTTQYIGEAEHCDRVALLAEGRLIAVDTPAGLRREALGGEVIELESAAPVDAAALGGLPAVRVLRQRGPRDLLAVTDDAASATPTILDALRDRGVEVVASREYRPPFDQVFAELVSRSRPGGARDADAQGTWEREGMA